MTFVTSDGVKQEADIYMLDVFAGQDEFPDNPAKQAMFMGWHALSRAGIEPGGFREWLGKIKRAPEIEYEEGDVAEGESPKEDSGGGSPSS